MRGNISPAQLQEVLATAAHAGGPAGFTYRMLHLAPALVADVLAGARGGRGGLPLFTAPVAEDARLARRLWRVRALLLDGPTGLEAHQLLTGTVLELVQRHASRRETPARRRRGEAPARRRRRGSPTRPSLGPDVLVEVEKVPRVVLPLDRDQPLVVAAEVDADAVLVVSVHEIDVAALL